MKVLQQEPGRTVVLEEGGLTVRKTFHGEDAAMQAELAAREFDRMNRFFEALTDVAAATCPRPIEMSSGPVPYLRMERAAGIPMQRYLAQNTLRSEDYQEMSEVLHKGLLRYVETFDEPYWDFILRNMFYDRAKALVTFIDFGVPTIYLPALDDLKQYSPLELSVGSLLASSIFEAARPRRMRRLHEHRQGFALARTVFDRFRGYSGGHDFTVSGVQRVARTTYGLAAGGGSRSRQLWYRRCGSSLARSEKKFARIR